MHPVVESILKDKEVLRELKARENEFVRKAGHGEANFGPYVESLARAPAAAARPEPGIEESLRRLESRDADFSDLGMTEAIIVRFGHPSLLIRDGTFEEPELEVWRTRLDPHRSVIDRAIGSVGRIELTGHRLRWVGTGWLIDEETIVTNRHVAWEFADQWTQYRAFQSGVSANMDFYEEHERTRELVANIDEIIHVESKAGVDMALMRLNKKAAARLKLEPIAIADRIRDEATIGVIGYPAYDPRNDDDDMARIFRDVFDKKRLAPGSIMKVDAPSRTFAHDCTTLGGCSGAAAVEVETGCAIGLHFGGRKFDRNLAVDAAAIRDVAASHRVKIRACQSGAGGDGGSGGAAAESPDSLAGRKGYDPLFLGEGDMAPVPLPALNPLQMRQAAKLADGSLELKYMHFSLVMNAARRLAFFTAVNIDGTDLWHKQRGGNDPWQQDPRIPEDAQVENELYVNNDFDRGHLVRRLDPVWGDKPVAKIAELDTFYYTNAAPQHKDLNRKIWLNLENHVLGKTDEEDARISVFAGPVFGSSDPRSRRSGLEQVGIPLGYWKVIVSIGRTRRGHRTLQSQAFVMWQWDMFGEADLELVFGRQFETYQLAVTDLERLTGLDFSDRVRDADTFEKEPLTDDGTESVVAGGRAGPRLQLEAIRSADDIVA